MELIRSELTGVFPAYRTDEEFMDAFGASHQYIRRIKCTYREHSPEYEDYAQ
jgi:hypothetical protein